MDFFRQYNQSALETLEQYWNNRISRDRLKLREQYLGALVSQSAQLEREIATRDGKLGGFQQAGWLLELYF